MGPKRNTHTKGDIHIFTSFENVMQILLFLQTLANPSQIELKHILSLPIGFLSIYLNLK